MFQSLSFKSTALGSACLIALLTSMPAFAQAQSAFVPEFTLAQKMENKAIAVVDFSNDTGDSKYDNLKRGISESLSTRLAKRPELKVIERGQIDKAIKELGFAQTGLVNSSTASQLGKIAGANIIVTGSLVRAGSLMQINARMINVQTGQILVSESYTFRSENEVFAVVNYLSLLIPKKLNLYVSDRELELAKQSIRGDALKADSDMSWVIWAVAGGVVIVGGIVAAVVLIRPSNTQTIVNKINTVTPQDIIDAKKREAARPGLNIPLFKF